MSLFGLPLALVPCLPGSHRLFFCSSLIHNSINVCKSLELDFKVSVFDIVLLTHKQVVIFMGS